jgi:hypothetical protein
MSEEIRLFSLALEKKGLFMKQRYAMIKSFYAPETSPNEDHFYTIDRV